MMKNFKWLLNQVKLSWVSLILKIKSLFQSNNTHHQPTASNGNDHARKVSVESKTETKGNKIDLEDVFEDALTEEELGEEEFFDAVESFDEQEVNANAERKEYEKNKYYSLQDSLQEKTEFDYATHTLALAFEINKPQLENCDPDLSKFKLCELKQNGDRYTFILEDGQKNRIELHSEYLNMHFPKYFEKHSKKRAYTELFSQKENKISNDIIIPLQVPKEASILTKKFGWLNPIRVKIQSKIPDFPEDIDLKDCKDHVNFSLNPNNTLSLSLISVKAQSAAMLSGTPTETTWPIKDIVVRGNFINQLDKRFRVEEVIEPCIDKQPIVEEAFEVVDVERVYQNQGLQPNI